MGAGHILEFTVSQLKEICAAAREYDMELTLNLGPPKDKNVASKNRKIREAGIDYLCSIIRRMKYLDAKTFIGVLYSCWPCDFSDVDQEGDWERSVESMKRVAKAAEEEGVTLCMEVVNRFDSYLINDCDRGLQYLDDVAEAFYKAGSRLGHVHAGEANRKLPGMGKTIPWEKIGKALRDIHYDGAVIMEPFLLTGGTIGPQLGVWRDLSGGADEKQMDLYLKEAVRFLRKNFLK